ncbi:hypothetical protein UFOVP142_44 [uncultured Caudovirales phage]|uniref:Uncharacterized protein n=1 Tax=uncultured Caudovirales phage TaxID=2100421 RepID=A0A6J7XUG2_9CAUD|nr:hypothetical protein UFOVP142_44 [uncultured Caudovirales phage]
MSLPEKYRDAVMASEALVKRTQEARLRWAEFSALLFQDPDAPAPRVVIVNADDGTSFYVMNGRELELVPLQRIRTIDARTISGKGDAGTDNSTTENSDACL